MESNIILSRFWTRIWSFFIDTIILGVFGFIIGLIFKDFFISLGENAKIIGWIISLIYFTILNSKIGNGQTLGKKILNIQVTNIKGDTISLSKSFIRSIILITPFFLNGFKIPGVTLLSVFSILQSIIIFGVGIGLILFYILNKETRQSLHDIVAKTYVVKDYRDEEWYYMPKYGKLSYFVFIGLFFVVSTIAIYNFTNKTENSKLISVYENIIKIDNVSNATVYVNLTPITDSIGIKRFIYTVNIKVSKNIQPFQEPKTNINLPELKKTVETFIQSGVYESENDILNVVVNSGFDIGIAEQNNWFNESKSVSEWKEVYK